MSFFFYFLLIRDGTYRAAFLLVNSFELQTLGQGPFRVSQFNETLSADNDANAKSGNDFTYVDWDYNAQQSFQDLIQGVRNDDIIPMPMPPNPTIALMPDLLLTVPPNDRFACIACEKTFKRDSDRIRHENSIHFKRAYLCPVAGCAKARGKGYSRPDKVREHLWKCHGDLGHEKRA